MANVTWEQTVTPNGVIVIEMACGIRHAHKPLPAADVGAIVAEHRRIYLDMSSRLLVVMNMIPT